MACMAIAAFAAFVIAPAASAVSLGENGSAVAVGSSITGQSGEMKFTASGNTVTCTSAHLSGTVTADSGGTFAAEIPAASMSFKGTGTGEDCTSEGLGPVKPTMNSKLCLHIAKSIDTATFTGCAGASVTYNLIVTNLGLICRYEAVSVVGSITTAPADAAVNMSEQPAAGEASNSIFCPGSVKLDMEFTLTTTGGTTLTFS